MRVLMFGTGRLGASMAPYLSHLGNEVRVADRAAARSGTAPEFASSDLIAAAIPDDALESWYGAWRSEIGARPVIHFSGAKTISGMRSYHPLYSFPRKPLPAEIMSGIAIAREEGAAPFADLFAGARNPEFVIREADRAYYHAIAVLTGNFAAHLWNEAAKGLADRLSLQPDDVLAPYLEGVVDRFREAPADSMTGPLARRDRTTVRANLQALAGEPRLKALYEAFIDSAWPGFSADEKDPDKGPKSAI